MAGPKTPEESSSLPTPQPSGNNHRLTVHDPVPSGALGEALAESPSERLSFPSPVKEVARSVESAHAEAATEPSSEASTTASTVHLNPPAQILPPASPLPQQSPRSRTQLQYSPQYSPSVTSERGAGGHDIHSDSADDGGIHSSPSQPLKTLLRDSKDPELEHLCELTTEKLTAMDLEESRATLASAVNKLRHIRAESVRYKMQAHMLSIETHESAQRHQVEEDLIKREVDRLLLLDHEGASASALNASAETYRRRLQKAKLKIRDLQIELDEKDSQISRLKKRLRDGRAFRQETNGGDTSTNNHLPHHSSALRAGHSQDSPRNNNQDNNRLAALGLLASQVLRQELANTSPKPKLETLAYPYHHNGSNSTSNSNHTVPMTPSGLMSPVDFIAPGLSPEKRRRESSASTISLQSEDPNATEDELDDEDDLQDDEQDDDEDVDEEDESPSRVQTQASVSSVRTPQGSPKKIVRR